MILDFLGHCRGGSILELFLIWALVFELRGIYTFKYWRKSCWRKYAQTVKSSPYTTQTIAKKIASYFINMSF